MIDPSTPYHVIDTRTGKTVYTTTYANRNRARQVRERKNQAFGAYRYACKVSS